MGPEYGTEENVNIMAAHGVNTLYDTLFNRADLIEWGIPLIQAHRMKEAADALRGRLGLAPVPEDVPVQAEVQVQRVIQDNKAVLKPIPVAVGSNKSNIADMAGRCTIAVWVASFVAARALSARPLPP